LVEHLIENQGVAGSSPALATTLRSARSPMDSDADPGLPNDAESQDIAPVRIGRRDPSRLVLEWRAGAVSDLPSALLRRACPCARCVHEVTGERLLDPRTIPDDLRHEHVELVGRYALALRFADGHQTGIFTWQHLRRLAGLADPGRPG
jgi:DUF971 family protein